ncbi:hypothetical protein GWI33_006290 [Rhynchophorus ferrugineus]|uniref:Uncharacterized protein n=1 Tax=Rhynchophorus ferrugineus TaxID=354439 RepID=A0A834MHG8_RHYFE|nr:hypothetical protein GWI33_006290 [Rhynchophorus ferrugineus]
MINDDLFRNVSYPDFVRPLRLLPPSRTRQAIKPDLSRGGPTGSPHTKEGRPPAPSRGSERADEPPIASSFGRDPNNARRRRNKGEEYIKKGSDERGRAVGDDGGGGLPTWRPNTPQKATLTE